MTDPIAEDLECREVVEAGKGAKTYEDPRDGSKLTVSDELIVGERHLAEVWPMEEQGRVSVSIQLTPEGEQRMIAATKDATPRFTRLAVIIEGRNSLLTVHDSVLIGRGDPEQGIFPEVDLSADDAGEEAILQDLRGEGAGRDRRGGLFGGIHAGTS